MMQTVDLMMMLILMIKIIDMLLRSHFASESVHGCLKGDSVYSVFMRNV